MTTQRFTKGPFQFTFRGDVVWWRYAIKQGNMRLKATGKCTTSMGYSLLAFLSEDDASERALNGLMLFTRWHMGELPEAIHWAEHYTRLHPLMPR